MTERFKTIPFTPPALPTHDYHVANKRYVDSPPIATKTAAYTLTASDTVALVSGTVTITLPTAVGITGKIYHIKNISNGVITIATDGSETIDGEASASLIQKYEAATLMSDGTNWMILSVFQTKPVCELVPVRAMPRGI
jgi:hypothetical protein